MSGKIPTLAVVTLGCSKNQVDTEHLLAQIQDNYSIVGSESKADYLLLNTCGFIGDAKEESIWSCSIAQKYPGWVSKTLVFVCGTRSRSVILSELMFSIDALCTIVLRQSGSVPAL